MIPNTAVVKAPPVTASLYHEALPMLYASQMAYQLSHLILKFRQEQGDVDLNVPDNFLIDLKQFVDKYLDLKEANDGNRVSFTQLYNLFAANQESLAKSITRAEFVIGIIEKAKEYLSTEENPGEDVYLSSFRSLIQCDQRLRVIVFFRGLENPGTNRDWEVNFDIDLTMMKTPKKVRDKMPEGPLQQGILVHEGFYDYLFDNEKVPGQQRYDDIINDIRPLLENEEGYSLYVTGHSLGGALANLFSCKIAGSEEKHNWLPRPVTCITFGAPMSGTAGYKAVVERLEIDGWIRSLRVNNGEDIVPAIPPFSHIYKGSVRAMKHTGINLHLTNNGISFTHSSTGGWLNAIRNSIFKPIWSFLKWHTLPLHDERFEQYKEILSATKLDELYERADVVGERFLKGEIDTSEVVTVDEDFMGVAVNEL